MVGLRKTGTTEDTSVGTDGTAGTAGASTTATATGTMDKSENIRMTYGEIMHTG